MSNEKTTRDIKNKIINLMNNEGLDPKEQVMLMNSLAIELMSNVTNKKTVQESVRLVLKEGYDFCKEFCIQHYERYKVDVKFIFHQKSEKTKISDLVLVTNFGVFKVYEKDLEQAKYLACKEAFKHFLV